MDTLETFHALTVGNHCFGQISNDLGLQELIELEVHTNDSSVPRTSERLLLKLTTIHRLFQLLLSGRTTCGKLDDICCYLLNQDITRKLLSCLEDSNQHVVFMASKAISSLMLSVHLISTTKIQLEGVFQKCSNSEWKSLYVMDILKQVLKSGAGDGPHNIRVPSQESLVCHCVSSEPRVLAKEKKTNVELLDLETQDWFSILPLYVPLWEKLFRSLYLENNMAEDPKCTPVDLLEYHSRLASSIHQEMIDSCFHISARSEQVFVSFLSFMAELLKFCCKVDPTDVLGGRISEKLEASQEMLLLKMVQVMPHFLHFRELSSEVWKEILKLLSFSLNISTLPPNSYHHQHQAPTNNYILHSATAFICAVNCCILDKIPHQSFLEGFGGSTVKPVTKDMGQTCQTRNPTASVFRQASLLVIQAALVLLNRCENYRNAKPRQDILKAMNIWYGSLIKVGTSNHGDQMIKEGSVNSDNQDEEPSIILMTTFADQDDEMIQMMLLLLQLFKVSREPAYRDVAVTLSTLNPHHIFQAFLKVIGFDHSVVLDFLISSETVFLEYLMQYLHFLLQDLEGFYQHSNSLVFEDTVTTDDNKLEVRHSLKRGLQSHTSDDKTILKPADHKPPSSLTEIMACNQASAKDVSCSRSSSLGLGGLSHICSAYGSDSEDDSDDDDGDGAGCDDIHAAATDNRKYSDSRPRQVVDIDIHDIDPQESISSCDNADHSYLSSGIKVKDGCNTDMGSVYDNDRTHDYDDHHEEDIGDDYRDKIIRNSKSAATTMLEKTMSTLIHTRIAAERLNEGSLFPYQVKPLINVIKKVENLYDGC